ncbi:MAG: ribosomal protein L7/L12 [Candidatus Parcubacteria bacterium]|uniref:ribosomal protein L7/L12 n=1 Tax=Phormidesmis priestleyi TaxID=268141 RepID=UPI00083AFDA7|nr:ribosomal protein L7/L12 [Phormidesmis priestleyi]MBC7825792.1 ribosomal protein L7/L12 [Leptolyngbyaceae cyanobacterium LF-bin-113]
MRRVNTIVAGMLLGIGLPISLVCVLDLIQGNLNDSVQSDMITALIFLGLLPLAIGSWLAFNNTRQSKKSERDRLQRVFFNLLRDGDGNINVLRFSMEANISGAEAKIYLDERAKEFNAAFNVSEEGRVFYYFDGEFKTPILNSIAGEETYDVVLEYVPPRTRQDVMRVIQQLTGLDEKPVKRVIKGSRASPIMIAENVTRSTADQFRRQLEAVGASVLIVLR